MIESTLRVGLDADGVILNGAEMKSRIIREVFGINVPPEKFCKKLVLESGVVSDDQYESMKTKAYNTEIALTFKFIEEAKNCIRKMIDSGWYIPVITNRNENAAGFLRQLFSNHNLNLDVYSNGGSRNSIDGSVASKLSIVQRLGGLHTYVDDDIEKLIPLVGIVPDLVLFSQPYNLDEDVEGIGGRRTYGWRELLNSLEYQSSQVSTFTKLVFN